MNFTVFMLVASSIVIIDFIAIIAISKVVDVYSVELVAGLLGFIGAIIGGALTLVGVLWTLEGGKMQRFIELYPKRKLKILEVVNEMESSMKVIRPLKNQ